MPIAGPATGSLVIPLVSEAVVVSKQETKGETVRISTVTHEHAWPVDEDLTHVRVEIERVAIGREVDAAPAVREEGDVTILPVVEEIVVIQRRLILREEVRIRRVRITEPHRETVMVRAQEAVITRTDSPQPADENSVRHAQEKQP